MESPPKSAVITENPFIPTFVPTVMEARVALRGFIGTQGTRCCGLRCNNCGADQNNDSTVSFFILKYPQDAPMAS